MNGDGRELGAIRVGDVTDTERVVNETWRAPSPGHGSAAGQPDAGWPAADAAGPGPAVGQGWRVDAAPRGHTNAPRAERADHAAPPPTSDTWPSIRQFDPGPAPDPVAEPGWTSGNGRMLPVETRTFDPLLDQFPLAPGRAFGQPCPPTPPAETRAWPANPLPSSPPVVAPRQQPPPGPPAQPHGAARQQPEDPRWAAAAAPADPRSTMPMPLAGAAHGERFDEYRPSTAYPAPPPSGSAATGEIALGGPLAGPPPTPAPNGHVPSWLREPTVSPARHEPAPTSPPAAAGWGSRGLAPDPRRRAPAPDALYPDETRQHRLAAQPPHPGRAYQGRPAAGIDRGAPRPRPSEGSHQRGIRQEAPGRGGVLPGPPPTDGARWADGHASRVPLGPPAGPAPHPDDGPDGRSGSPSDADRQHSARGTGSGRHRGARNDHESQQDRGPLHDRRHFSRDDMPVQDQGLRQGLGHRQVDHSARQDGGPRLGRGSRQDYGPYPDDGPSLSADPYALYPDGAARVDRTRRPPANGKGSEPYPSDDRPSAGAGPGGTGRPPPAQPGPREAGSRAGLLTSALLPPPPQTASRGWRKLVYQVSAGAVNPGPSPDEVRDRRQIARIRTPLLDCHRVAVLSLKGGVGKTTTTVAVGSTLASLRGDRVVAIDANPDRGTLGSKVPRTSAHTVRELLEDAHRLHRYVDVRKYLSQADSRLEVLASANDPELSDTFGAEDYRAVDDLLQRHYSILLTDCGTGILHSAMHGVLQLADTLVIVSSATADGGTSASATLDWLDAHGYAEHVREAVTVISIFPTQGERVDVDALARHFEARTRRVVQVPFDPHLADGGRIVLSDLKRETQTAYREIAGAVAERFGEERGSRPH